MKSFIFLLGLLAATQAYGEAPYFDSFPPEIASSISTNYLNQKSAANKINTQAAQFILSNKLWQPGSRILVAFNGGDTQLHQYIEKIAKTWMRYANIELDFGYDPITKKYRTWSENDSHYTAQIRIGFSQQGYWSYIGTDSISDIVEPNMASMNFNGFDTGWPHLRQTRWETVILHEFGHALGFHHEHQHPTCADEYRWERGANNEQSVYDVFASWQHWDKNTVDVNLRPVGEAVSTSKVADRFSIMFYAMPEQVFTKGSNSKCYVPIENTIISNIDRLAARKSYPKNPTDAIASIQAYARAVGELALITPANLTKDEASAVQQKFATIEKASRPILYIQIYREKDRDLARSLITSAKANGFIAPGIENVGRKARPVKNIEIRYFRELDLASAQKAASILPPEVTRSSSVKIVKVRNASVKNIIEVWIP